jgi:hypothetical protein
MAHDDEAAHPGLVFIFGPPAVGKMAVGHELARRTGFRLFHNHHTVDLALRFFAFGTPPFQRLVREFRRRVFEEVAASSLPGLIFTYVWAFNEQSDDAAVAEYAAIFTARGGRVVYAELECELSERLRRNETEFRLAEKPSKRDVPRSRSQLLELDTKYQLNSRGKYDGRPDYFRFDNTAQSASAAAEKIIERFALRTIDPPAPGT